MENGMAGKGTGKDTGGTTYIEFFERVSLVENLCSSLLSPPARVVLVGDRAKMLRKQADRYASILKERGAEVEFVCRPVNKSSMRDVLGTLAEIAEEYDDCLFDLTGGDEVMLAAAGMIYERFRGKKRIQMHRYNVLSGAIQDCDLDEDTSRTVACGLSVDEDLRLYGGSIVYDDVQANATPRWDLTGDLENDIDAMWEICRKNTRLWNRQTGLLKSAEKHSLPQTDPLVCAVPLSVINGDPEFEGGASVFRRPFFRSLKRAGLLETAEREGTLLLIYKNGQIRRCLTKEGQALEMKIYLTALRAREKDGSPSYGDVKNGVVIDWDGLTHDEEGVYDTENEIDVLMMHGMVPVFVSCKNGFVETEELYKLNTVAERFGGRYARRVLVAADPGGAAHAAALRERAKDMRIRMVEGIQEMSDAELLRTVRSFWSMS